MDLDFLFPIFRNRLVNLLSCTHRFRQESAHPRWRSGCAGRQHPIVEPAKRQIDFEALVALRRIQIATAHQGLDLALADLEQDGEQPLSAALAARMHALAGGSAY